MARRVSRCRRSREIFPSPHPPRKTETPRLVALIATFALIATTRAADIDGKWKAEFDSQIGKQVYVFELKADGEKLTGKASRDAQGQKSELALKDGKIAKDDVSFVEPLKVQDRELRVEYKGKITGDELKLHRCEAHRGTKVQLRLWQNHSLDQGVLCHEGSGPLFVELRFAKP